jgi:hypothetical protein
MSLAWKTACGALLLVAGIARPAFAVGGEDAPGTAASVSTLDVQYDIYLGGVSLGALTMSVRIEGDAYKAISSLQTSGVANAFSRTKIDGSSNGRIADGVPRPLLYFANSQHGEKNQQVTVKFPLDGPPTIFAEPAYRDPQRILMADELKLHALDPVSAMVSFTTSFDTDQKNPCDIKLPVYDARRRYDVGLSYVRKSNVRMDNGLYEGPVEICKVDYKPLAGARQNVLKNGKFPPIYAWLTSLQSSADPARRYMLPLRIWVESELGIGAAVASSIKLDGTKLVKLR